MNQLDLRAYADELERQGEGKRSLQLDSIVEEIRYPYRYDESAAAIEIMLWYALYDLLEEHISVLLVPVLVHLEACCLCLDAT